MDLPLHLSLDIAKLVLWYREVGEKAIPEDMLIKFHIDILKNYGS